MSAKKKIIKESFFNHYGDFQPLPYLCQSNDVIKLNTIYISVDSSFKCQDISKKILNYGFNYIVISESNEGEGNNVLASKDGNCIILFYNDENRMFLKILYNNKYKVNSVMIKDLLSLKRKKEDKKNKVSFVIKTNSGLDLLEKSIKISDVHLDNYELSTDYQQIVDNVNNDKPGLILFSGLPGTGKSYFVRHLINNLNKNFVYIPVNIVDVLSDPSFITFAINNLSNSVLIIEDAEQVLMDRANSNSAAATILNITDGLLSELLNLKIIATINVERDIDHALLRKGRLLNKVDFNKLPVDKANRVLERLNKKERVITETALTDLYNIDINNGHEVVQKRKIGFNN